MYESCFKSLNILIKHNEKKNTSKIENETPKKNPAGLGFLVTTVRKEKKKHCNLRLGNGEWEICE